MSKNSCLIQARWFKDELFKHYIRKKMTLLQYAVIALKMSVLPIRKRLLKVKKHKKGLLGTSVLNH